MGFKGGRGDPPMISSSTDARSPAVKYRPYENKPTACAWLQLSIDRAGVDRPGTGWSAAGRL